MGGRWVRPLPLRWRVLLLLMVLAALLIGDAVVGAAYYARLESQQRVAAQLRAIEEIPERLVSGLAEQQNSVRGFALTGDDRLLDTYRDRQQDEGRSITNLRRRLRGQPTLLDLLAAATATATAWHRRVAEPVIGATRAGRTQRASRLVSTLDEPLFNAMRRDASALGRALDVQLRTSQERALDAGRRLDRLLLATSVFGIVLVLWSGWLIRRWLTHPVADLSVQLRRVAAGQLTERIAGSGPVEFRRLGHDAEVMRRRIIGELEENRRAMEALEQDAPLVASLRSELASPAVELPAGISIAGRLEPAEGVLAGDWIEAIRLVDDRVGLVVVDVSGHGPEAGLRALWLKHLLVPALHLELDPADALHWVAGQIGDTGEWFATIVILELVPGTGRCRFANAGHPPALVLGPRGIRELSPTGPLFNVLPEARWETAETRLEEDEVLVVYTDGITEARNVAGEEFGQERLERSLEATYGLDGDTVADRVMQQVHDFGSPRLMDDATLAVVTRPVSRRGASTGGGRAGVGDGVSHRTG
jgi:serine phosphatase RsbU (regulator of sigma subunit)/CHASE3 domain sensor protein